MTALTPADTAALLIRQGIRVLAIDGPAASGKGTLARRLAEFLGFAWLDTGKLYRAVGLAVLRAGTDPDTAAAAAAAARGLDLMGLDDPALKDEATGRAASQVAAHGDVRAALLDLQRHFARVPPGGAKGAVLDGRDIGTVICPEARVKIYVDAAVEVRAERRFKELQSLHPGATFAAVLQDLQERDRRDKDRAVAPLKPAADAVVLDTTHLDADTVFAEALAIVVRAAQA